MNIKNNQTNAQNKLGKLPIWNLKDLYLSQKDKSLIRDLNITILVDQLILEFVFRVYD